MAFWMGVIVGSGFGAFLYSLFYMFVVRWALSKKAVSESEFQKIQKTNGEHIKRIAEAAEEMMRRQ